MGVIFKTTLNQTMVLFILMLIGFVIKKKKLVGEGFDTILSRLLTNVIIVALVFSTFVKNCTLDALVSKADLFICGTVLSCIAYGASLVISRLLSKERYMRNVYSYSLTTANVTYFGFPVIVAVFGEEMLFNVIVYFIPLLIYTYTLGLSALEPNKEVSFFKSLVNPMFIAMILGAIIGISGIKMPKVATTVLDSLTGCIGPLSMILTGYVIACYKIKDMLIQKKVYIVAMLRLVIIPTLFVLLIKAFNVSGDCIVATLCTFAMPIGLNTVIFPAAYGEDPKVGASMALISTSLALITIPLIFAVFL